MNDTPPPDAHELLDALAAGQPIPSYIRAQLDHQADNTIIDAEIVD